ncbi:hypothetical protein H4R35_001548 [Dimargaris xerosporica]|nr:hypothetical protein H4R35_001548 [Dimargaris xerosporica]
MDSPWEILAVAKASTQLKLIALPWLYQKFPGFSWLRRMYMQYTPLAMDDNTLADHVRTMTATEDALSAAVLTNRTSLVAELCPLVQQDQSTFPKGLHYRLYWAARLGYHSIIKVLLGHMACEDLSGHRHAVICDAIDAYIRENSRPNGNTPDSARGGVDTADGYGDTAHIEGQPWEPLPAFILPNSEIKLPERFDFATNKPRDGINTITFGYNSWHHYCTNE